MCFNRDIVCWVDGCARRIILRPKEKNGPVLLDVSIPHGIYIMSGEYFQRRSNGYYPFDPRTKFAKYTHEIPREQPSLFEKLLVLVPDDISDKGKICSADWLSNNEDVVKRNFPLLYKKFLLWNTYRCSYTVRFFTI